MKLFNTLALEISSQCNRKCVFCPVAYNQREDERMPQRLVDKACEELGALDYRGRVELYIYNEPCKDMPWLLDVLRQLRAQAPHVTLMVATNGDYLHKRGKDAILEMYDAGLNQLLVNCYSPGLYDKRQEWTRGAPVLPEWDGIKIGGPIYSAIGPRKKSYQILDKSDPAEFGKGIFGLTNRAGAIEPFLPATCEPAQRMCVRPFRLLNINWRGNAMLCCQDYHARMGFASFETRTLVEIWNHEVLNTYREHLLRKDRSLPLCRSCDCHSGAYPGNVPKPDGEFATPAQIERIYKENDQ